jgi:hypothetical protein
VAREERSARGKRNAREEHEKVMLTKSVMLAESIKNVILAKSMKVMLAKNKTT